MMFLALVRLFSFAVHDPVLGYANQYDMARTSACLDLWPADSANPAAATVDAPLRWYQRRHVPAARCHPGSEVPIAGLIYSVAESIRPQERYDIRLVGLSKAVILSIFMLLFCWLLRGRPTALLIHSVVVLTVLVDPANLLYLNTLYGEFSALIGGYIALTSVGICMIERRLSWSMAATLLLGLVVLLTSKMQHLLLPWIVFLIVCFAMRQFDGRRRLLVVGSVLLVVSAWQINVARQADEAIHYANIYNAAFLTILPALPDQRRAMDRLGLPPDCLRLVGTSWFQRRGHDIEKECPEALSLSRAGLVKLLAAQPRALIAIVARSVYQSGGWTLGFVGHVEGETVGQIDRQSGMHFLSYAAIPKNVTFPVYVGLIAFPFLYVLAFGALQWHRRPSAAEENSLFTTLLICVVAIPVIWSVSLIGDGFSDLAKHLHLAINLLLAGWLFLMAHAVVVIRAASHGRIQLLAGTAGLLVATTLVSQMVAVQPVAIGTLDAPSLAIAAGSPHRLTGWTKDPFGIQAIEAHVDRQVFSGTITSDAADVDQMFPLTRQHPGRRFGIDLRAPIEEGWFRVAIRVRNNRGIETEFDSVWMEAVR